MVSDAGFIHNPVSRDCRQSLIPQNNRKTASSLKSGLEFLAFLRTVSYRIIHIFRVSEKEFLKLALAIMNTGNAAMRSRDDERSEIRELKLGMEGYDVKLAQAALQCWGYSIVVTGIFGKEMDEKIRDFQEAKGCAVDGEIGEETWKELLKV